MKVAIKSHLETKFGLLKNPFPGNATYGEDSQVVYVPEMFGDQRKEFLRKFILAPLENGQPLIGAVWSVVPGDPEARGFGKSTLMGEEAKLVNQDFGRATLAYLDVADDEAQANPILCSYVAFNTKAQGGIANIDAAAFHLTRFILRQMHGGGGSMHLALRELAAAKLMEQGKASPGAETDSIIDAVRERFRKLAGTIDFRNLLEDYLQHLASPDTEALQRFLADEVGTWHHDRNGLKYLQIFVAFAELAGIEHMTFFVDQVEDFTSQAGAAKLQKNVKIIRDALIETEPFASRVSFVFQFHPDAYERLQNAWLHEDLRSLAWDEPLNAPYVVVLEGLQTFASAKLLADKCLNHPSVVASNRKPGINPFTEGALKLVWKATKPRPRWFLRVLYDLLQIGKDARVAVIDETFIKPKLEGLGAAARSAESDVDTSDDRLA
jgi:hypothetical protein